METIVLPGRAAVCREGKGNHFVKLESLLHQMDALPSRFVLAGHDSID